MKTIRPRLEMKAVAFVLVKERLKPRSHEAVLGIRTTDEMDAAIAWRKRIEISKVVLGEDYMPSQFPLFDQFEPLFPETELVIEIAVAASK